MQLNSNILNKRYIATVSEADHTNFLSGRKSSQKNLSGMDTFSFTGIREEAEDVLRDTATRKTDEIWSTAREIFARKSSDTGLFDSIKNRVGRFIRENITDGVDITYNDASYIKEQLEKNFGHAFDDCFADIDYYINKINPLGQPDTGKIFNRFARRADSGKIEPIVYRMNTNDDTIMFHKDPFFKNLCKGVKEFTVGQFLDFCLGTRKLIRKANSYFGTSDIISLTKAKASRFGQILDNREAEKRAMDAYYKLVGVFGEATEGIENIASKYLTPDAGRLEHETKQTIADNIKKLAGDSIEKASKKVGKYNTKSERAWNRLGTGFVSALFAATENYNISMLENNEPKKAQKAGRERFQLDMTRQGLTAFLTFVVLGAFQNKVNKSIFYAVLSLGGVTLISEVLSRVLQKKPLRRLSPEDARKIAEEREEKERHKTGKPKESSPSENTNIQNIQNPFINTENKVTSHPNTDMEVFSVFTNKINASNQNGDTSFTANAEALKKQENKKKKRNIWRTALKFTAAAVGLSLGVGFVRSRNILGIDTAIKSVSEFFGDLGERLTKKRLVLPKDDVDDFLKYLRKNGFSEQYNKLRETLSEKIEHDALNGQSPIVQKYLPKKEINPNGLYYDLGTVEAKGKATAVKVITYPFNAISKVVKSINNLIKEVFFGVKAPKPSDGTDLDKVNAFMETYVTKFRDAQNKGLENSSFKDEITNAFTLNFSEATSKHKNTTIAMVSRLLVTIVSGYFFVNDHRNQVLIESKGKNVEGANAKWNEKVGHKVANFFFNSMFMDMFNTTFEPIYLGSVVGATAVAMATEVTNETAVRASVGTPTTKMTREEIIEYENKHLNTPGLLGAYYRWFSKITGKKVLSEKVGK